MDESIKEKQAWFEIFEKIVLVWFPVLLVLLIVLAFLFYPNNLFLKPFIEFLFFAYVFVLIAFAIITVFFSRLIQKSFEETEKI